MRSVALGLLVVGACTGGDGNQTPDTQIDSQPAALTNIARSEFAFSALGNANMFLCAIDGVDPSPCIPPLIVDLADGQHTFEVAAALNAHVDETPATYTWRIDTIGPDTTILAGPPAIDNDPTPDFTFEGNDGGNPITFVCSLDGAAATPCTSPFALSVVDGNHTFSVAAVDAAGNRDATPATHDWNVNTITPDTTITAGPTDGSTTNANVTFGFNSPDTSATFECAMDAAAFAACTTNLNFPALGDGSHTFSVRAVGTAGPDPSPATRSWTVDAIAPPVAITGTPGDPSNVTTPQFTFTSTDVTATFECQIDGVQAFAACTSPFDSPALADGTRTFRIRATDPVGNRGSEATFAWLVDTVAPTVTFTTQPLALSSDTTPTTVFTTAGAPITIECQVDTGALGACTSPFTAAAQPDGTHTITVRVTDTAGNAGTATTNSFDIDTVAPTVAITGEPLSLSNDNTPTVTFTTAGAPTSTQCRADAGAFTACTSPFTTGALVDGTHTITVRVTDGANNTSSAITASFVIDTTPPTVTINTQPAALSNDNTPTVTFITGGAPTTIECQVDAGAFASCTSPFTAAAVIDGSHTITIRVTDAATNTASETTATFTVDTTPPTVVINTEPAPISNDNTPTVTFTTSGSPTSTQCQVDTGAFANCTSPFTAAAVIDGTHTITIRVTDAATNTASVTTSPFVVDTVPPTVTINTQPAALSNDNTPSVTFTTGGAPTSIDCRVDTGAFASCTSPFTAAAVIDGSHTITVRVTDAATNTASATTAPFVVDTTPPTIVINSEPAPISNDTTPTVTFTTGGAPTSIQCQVDTGAFTACSSPFTAAAVLDGSHTITIQATDAATNSFTISTSPFVVDTVPPTVTINTEPLALSNDNTPTVTFTTGGAPTSTQCRIDAGSFATCSSPFTPTVGDGTHTITIRVTDAATNTASATTNAFTVETAPPVVAFDDKPPAQWPVNYFDMKFHATDAHPIASIECSLNGAAFSACASPLTITTTYNVVSTFRVRATDSLGNLSSPITTAWTSSDGLVLHYPWEQGSAANTSLLAQNAAYSPDGPAAGLASFLGGWAGTALGSTVAKHDYLRTDRALSSSANDQYTASFWVRPFSDVASGTIVSTIGASAGFDVKISGNALTVEVRDGAQTFSTTIPISLDRWVNVGLRTTGLSKNLEIWIDGNFVNLVSVPLGNGFGPGQNQNVSVGGFTNLDLDDLRFYNKALAAAEMCKTVARGSVNVNGSCVALSPGFELAFENGRIADSGAWQLPLDLPQTGTTIVAGKLGHALTLIDNFDWGYAGGFQGQVASAHGHAFSFWFLANATFGASSRLIDFSRQCAAGGPPDKCGIAVTYIDNAHLDVFVGSPGFFKDTQVNITAPGKFNSVVVTEQRSGNKTISISVFVNGGPATVIPVPVGDVFAAVRDNPRLVFPASSQVDEYQFWTEDISATPEILCENGFDGEFDLLTGSCSLTSN